MCNFYPLSKLEKQDNFPNVSLDGPQSNKFASIYFRTFIDCVDSELTMKLHGFILIHSQLDPFWLLVRNAHIIGKLAKSSPNNSLLNSVQSLSSVWLFATPWTTALQGSLSTTNSWSLLKLTSIKSVMSTNYLILCHPLLLPPSIFPSIRVFSNESILHMRWPNYGSFSFSISPSDEYSELISFRFDWLDLLAVQGTLKSLLQHHSSKASVLWHSVFFIVQLSHLYMTTG